jgi:DNA-binding response OmpR family regulator
MSSSVQAKRILVVDDDPEIVGAIRTVLEAHGYEVFCAANGYQGQVIADQHKPDLIILDMMMPKRGGFPVLESMARKPGAPPIIMITANEGSRHKAYAEMLGVVDYIRKPFAMERLLESIDRVFNPGSHSPATPDSASAEASATEEPNAATEEQQESKPKTRRRTTKRKTSEEAF